MGTAAWAAGAHDHAVAFYEESARVGAAADRPHVEGAALLNIANVELTRRRPEVALAFLERARPLMADGLANPDVSGPLDFNEALAHLLLGRIAEAETGFARALAVGVEHDWPEGILYPLLALGLAAVAAGRGDTGVVVLSAAEKLRGEHGLHLEPVLEEEREHALARAVEVLGERRFDAAWASGHALSRQEAIELALPAS
jgi:tetratricopeptide (TPR) repeat protein